ERALLQAGRQNLARLAEQRAATERRAADLERERGALAGRNRELEVAHGALLAQIDELRAQIGPAEEQLADREAALADTERKEAALTAALLEAETAHGRAALELQRARDRIDTLWERAATDDIDIEALMQVDERPATSDQRPATNDQRPIGDDGADAERSSLVVGHSSDADRSSSVVGRSSAEGQDAEDLHERIQGLRARIHRLGVVNPLALEEYEEAAQRHAFLSGQIDDLRRASAALIELVAELDAAMRARFEATFSAVAAEFERSFTRLFGGGQAQLILLKGDGARAQQDDSRRNGHGEAPLQLDGLGVEIIARPPGKRQQTLALLSGGERALTAAALLFAILTVNPSPFCVLDEVDAALDESNVGRFREALADLTRQTQFLVVTHNRGTIEIADTIYGVSMGEDGASRVLSLRLDEIERAT
ncbi:MAG TPA: chromosome segregation protein SMC, partial [Roseiflexaceae bacterium]|nr:chromosome segregation protein SMC [Roseiflexaceae bacterium]